MACLSLILFIAARKLLVLWFISERYRIPFSFWTLSFLSVAAILFTVEVVHKLIAKTFNVIYVIQCAACKHNSDLSSPKIIVFNFVYFRINIYFFTSRKKISLALIFFVPFIFFLNNFLNKFIHRLKKACVIYLRFINLSSKLIIKYEKQIDQPTQENKLFVLYFFSLFEFIFYWFKIYPQPSLDMK